MKESALSKKRLFLVSIVGLFCTSVAIPMATATVTKNARLESVQNSTVRLGNILTQPERNRQTISNTVITAQSAAPTNVQSAFIKFRTYIPCEAVNLYVPRITGIWGGDDKSIQQASVYITDSQVSTSKSPIYFGLTSRYDISQGFRVKGKPSWCWQIKPNQSPKKINSNRLVSTDNNNKIVINRVGNNVQVIFFLNAPIPPTSLLEKLANPFVPAINADISVLLRPRKGGGLEYTVLGTHDGFPAYEIEINNNLVYLHNPIKTGETPASLFPPSEHRVSIPWKKVPPYKFSVPRSVRF